MAKQPRALAVHDISCFGRCSLTVALPIISAGGVECTVLPTAVLSTHTGGLTGYTYRDLTEDFYPILDHWESLGIKFDTIYTGFLGSFDQIDMVCDLVDRFGKDATVVVDPVMADFGKMYPVFSNDFPQGMRKLCAKADVIIPNITEAVFMLGKEYHDGPYTKECIKGLLDDLASIGPRKIILTGVSLEEGRVGAASFDSDEGTKRYYFRDVVPGYYHGTGDVFGSATVTALMNGHTLHRASEIAVDYTVGSILRTHAAGTDIRFGVNFEAGIPDLIQDLRRR